MKTILKTPFALLLAITLFSNTVLANTATIEKVIQGDRVLVQGWEIVRLTGIIAPRLNEPFGTEAFEFARQELEGKLVVISTYTTDNTAKGIVRDENGFCFIHILYGEIGHEKGEESGSKAVDFNALMLKKGFARVNEDYLPESLQHYLQIEKEAKDKKLGIWSLEK